jgi:hypothetical protein
MMRSSTFVAFLCGAALLVGSPMPADAQEMTVAVPPIVHAELPPDSGHAFAHRIAAHVATSNPGATVLGPDVIDSVLVNPDIAAVWDRLLFIFLTTGIVDDVGLAGLCAELEIDAILPVELAALIDQGPWVVQKRYVVKGLRTWLRAWFFDCSSGTVVWERSGRGGIEDTQDTRVGPYNLTQLPATTPASIAVGDLIDDLPRLDARRTRR